MYYQYFGLAEAPFSISPNPEYLYITERHQEALAHLFHSLESDAGFVLLTGEIGTGKTTVCRSFLEKLPINTQIAFILNPCLSGRELLQTICHEFSISSLPENATLRQLTNAIYQHLLNNHASDMQTVLLIDEAQHLHPKVLELVRLLTNLETDTQKLLKIILVGQPELNDILDKPELIQLSQRITARYHIKPLCLEECGAYINYRLRVAGYLSEKKLFPSPIVKRIYQVTLGVPRLINVVCDRALLGTYAQSRSQVNKPILEKAITEIRGEHRFKRKSILLPMASLTAGLVLAVILGFLFVPIRQPFIADTQLSTSNQEKSTLTVSKALLNKSLDQKQNPQSVDQQVVLSDIHNRDRNNQSLNGELDNVPDITVTSVGSKLSGKKLEIAHHYYTNIDVAVVDLISAIKTDLPVAINNCQSLIDIDWQCRKINEKSWSMIRKINRPIILFLENNLGESYFVAITGLTSSHAQALTSNGVSLISLAQLNQYWIGEFVYLWQPPEGFIDHIFVNSSEYLVNWLANAFSIADGRDKVLANERFSTLLKQRVILFQRENNLVEDGIAGVETILRLNEKLGIAITLNQSIPNKVLVDPSDANTVEN